MPNYITLFKNGKVIFALYKLVWNTQVNDTEAFNEYRQKLYQYRAAQAEEARINAIFGDKDVITDEEGHQFIRPNIVYPEIDNFDLGPQDFKRIQEMVSFAYSEQEKDELETRLKNNGISDYIVYILDVPSEFVRYKLDQEIVPTSYEALLGKIDLYEGMSADYLKELKMEELRTLCQNEIFKGFKADVLEEGTPRTYELKILDQVNYNSQITKFNLDPSLEGVVWSSNEGPAYYTKEQWMSLVPYIDATLNYNWNIFYVVKSNIEAMTDRISIDQIDVRTSWQAAKEYIDGLDNSDAEEIRTDTNEDEIPSVIDEEIHNDEPIESNEPTGEDNTNIEPVNEDDNETGESEDTTSENGTDDESSEGSDDVNENNEEVESQDVGDTEEGETPVETPSEDELDSSSNENSEEDIEGEPSDESTEEETENNVDETPSEEEPIASTPKRRRRKK